MVRELAAFGRGGGGDSIGWIVVGVCDERSGTADAAGDWSCVVVCCAVDCFDAVVVGERIKMDKISPMPIRPNGNAIISTSNACWLLNPADAAVLFTTYKGARLFAGELTTN